jgi:hypothetical protein
MQAIDERGARLAQILDRALGFANRVSDLAEIAG